MKSSPSTNLLKTPQTGAKVATPSTGAPARATPAKPVLKDVEPAVASEPEEESQLIAPFSLFDSSYDALFAAIDANGPLTVLDLPGEDTSWLHRSNPGSPIDTPESSSTRESDISENDNLRINIGGGVPDGWLQVLNDETLPLDVELSEDLQSLGVTLPTMESDDLSMFLNPDMMDMEMTFDSFDAKKSGSGPTTSLDMLTVQ
jgi:hypothetical protein